MKERIERSRPAVLLTVALLLAAAPQAAAPDDRDLPRPVMVLVSGGVFRMGDMFAEGADNERPVHEVELSDYYLGRHEVTVAEYRTFVDATGYLTRAERFDSRDLQQARYDSLIAMARTGRRGAPFRALAAEFMASGGCHCWRQDSGRFDFSLDCSWTAPQFGQSPGHPVVCLAWVDAVAYCNWRSGREGLPPAYDQDTGALLDASGQPTEDVTAVRGYRLPTEAEWEYAARERGEEVRFGDGTNAARWERINLDAAAEGQAHCIPGGVRPGTTRVGSFPPNALGLCDMSGNAWEWCSDSYGPYGAARQWNPLVASGPARVLRGGRWGGPAREARVFARSPYEPLNRCNASGFRLARSR